MLNYGKFTNFLFYRFYMKKREFQQEKQKKIGQGSKLCRDIVSECREKIPI